MALLLLNHIVLVALLPTMERTMYRYSIQHAVRWFHFVAADSVAPLASLGSWLLVTTGFPYLVHFAPTWASHSWHEGPLPSYLAILATQERLDLALKMQSKLFWAETFRAESIPTPQILAVVQNGAAQASSPQFDPHSKLILKPVQGWMGRGVQKTTVEQFTRRPMRGQWIAQEPILAPTHEAESIRLVSILNGSSAQLLVALKVSNPQSDSVTSNLGSVRRIARLSEHQGALALRLLKLHEDRFERVPTISWDLMEDARNSRTVVLEGNAPGALCWKNDACNDVLSRAERLYRRFFYEYCW